ncbi:MAG: ABC transporter ATP-binding protein [Treponema sp.]|nr:ABC transporter ATP-binding protein [Treponema sp.]
MALLKCKDLAIGYEGKAILKNISFEVNSGDYICIVGHNGSGKSTLMKTILGLQKPLDGEIEFSDGLLENQIGYLPQQTLIQRDFPASVQEVVLSGCQNKLGFIPLYKPEHKKRARENLERIGILSLEKKSYRELSGGQQQRVLLARALCAAEKMILLDEPVTGLDPRATAEMYEVIQELNRNGMAVIMISHDMDGAERYAKRILQLNKIEGTVKWEK